MTQSELDKWVEDTNTTIRNLIIAVNNKHACSIFAMMCSFIALCLSVFLFVERLMK